MLEPIRLAHIKPGFLRNCYSDVKVGSTLEFLAELCIILEFGKEDRELFF